MAQRKNYNFEDNVVERLEAIGEYFGMNQTATVAMLITEKYNQLKKEGHIEAVGDDNR